MTPFGYRIVYGKALPDDENAARLALLFRLYLDGWSIRDCAAETGMTYKTASGALSNRTYLGTDFYPQLIDEATFSKAQEERQKRKHSEDGRTRTRQEPLRAKRHFRMNERVFDGVPEGSDPVAWLYENIETGDDDAGYDPVMKPEQRERLRQMFLKTDRSS